MTRAEDGSDAPTPLRGNGRPGHTPLQTGALPQRLGRVTGEGSERKDTIPMNAPVHDQLVHERQHRDVADPACAMCGSMMRHPAGDELAARREAKQHTAAGLEAEAQAMVDADDAAFLRGRMWLFTLCAAIFLPAGIILAIVVDAPAGKILSLLVAVSGIGYAAAAWDLWRNTRARSS